MSETSSPPHCIFDLDGTIFDTRPLVSLAYDLVGVQLRDEFWGRTWREWLVPLCGGDVGLAELLHKQKGVFYDKILEHVQPEMTTAGQLLVELAIMGETPITILTGASIRAASRLTWQLGAEVYVKSGLTTKQKIERLRDIPGSKVYVDDDLAALQEIRKAETGARLVEFRGQRVAQLRREVLDGWTQ